MFGVCVSVGVLCIVRVGSHKTFSALNLNSTLLRSRCAERTGGDTADTRSHPSVGLAAEFLAFMKYRALLNPYFIGTK